MSQPDKVSEEAPAAVRMQGIVKRFGSALANGGIDLEIRASSIHGLIGENGAGKSTIMKILYGMFHADEGEIWIHGEKIDGLTPQKAIDLGIGMVHQHFMLVENLTVLDNIILGSEPCSKGLIDRKTAKEKIQDIFREMGLDLPLYSKVHTLSVGQQQIVELVKLLYRKASIVILDEPTAVLTPNETEGLFKTLLNLKRNGRTIVIITHKLPEVMAITDRITVLRGGKKICDLTTQETQIQDLAAAMIGRAIENIYHHPKTANKKPLLELKKVSLQGVKGILKLSNLNLVVHSHEIVGIAGVTGNGQRELEEVISGLDTGFDGEILHHETAMAHIPEDRHRSGLILDWPLWENALLGHQHDRPYLRCGFFSQTSIQTHAEKLIDEFQIHPPAPDLPAKNFSGGNQQKIVLARELEQNPDFILVAQPTRGVDIGAIEFIHKKLMDLRDQGSGILLISADLDELMALSDRIIVMCGGKITGEVNPAVTKEKELGLLMSGHAA